MKKVKVDLGGGRNPKKGFVNVDKWDHKCVDIKCDFENEPLPFDDESVDEIYTHHMLEHLPFVTDDNKPLLDIIIQECYRILKHDGILDLTVPDFEEACHNFLDGRVGVAEMMMFGGHTDNPYDWHHSGYSTKILKDTLRKYKFAIKSTDYPEWYGQNIHIIARKK